MDMNLINPIDRDALGTKIRNAQPFPHFCIDNFLNVDFANEVCDSFPDYQGAKAIGREFSGVNENYKIQITDSTRFPPAIARLSALLASQEFLDMWSDLIGIPDLLADPDLIGGGIHETNSGGRLDVHVDFNFMEKRQWHRRLNILIYFNRDWKEDYGGYLDIWDKDVKKCYGSFAPIFNRACGFATSEISFHGVRPLTCPPTIARKSFATYYYTQEPPPHWNGHAHSTIFKARPDEWMRGHVLMPAESTVAHAKQGLRKVKRAMKKLVGKPSDH
ncbi:MAG: 2OG-Fe(II) oxygenase [Steroidobacteraceae bacterium]|jgi:Rps23 Pro-64 3,4-dihydroxylase Tpa1-like proline 4-hydroxylase